MSLRFLLVCALALSGACGDAAGAGSGGTGGTAGQHVGAGGAGGTGGTGATGSGGTGATGTGGTGATGTGGTGATGTGGTGATGSGGTGGTAGTGGGGNTAVVTDLQVTPFISGLNHPWDIAWLPNANRTVLVTEREGRLNVYVDGVGSEPFTIAPSDVVAQVEGGMLGLEVDPEFARNGYVYVCMVSNADGDTDVRLVRFTLARPNGDAQLARTDIVKGMPYTSGRHSGCRPRFGPDGYLWVGTGDGADYTAPQDNNSLGGKVLRVDRDGKAAPDNPGGYRWFSKGHRNVQGIAFRQEDELGVSAEHGPTIDDEINLLVSGNFGWDPGPGYNESVPMTDLDKYPDAKEAIWSSGDPTLALAGATFIEGSAWGNWDGALAVATLKAEHLHIYFVTSKGKVTDELRVMNNGVRLRSPRQGSDGLLYVTDDGGGTSGRVLRVSPVLSPASQ